MAHVNKVMLVGNLGADAEVRTPQGSERKVISLRVATSRKYTGRDGNVVEETQWHNVSYWVKQESKITDYLKKGTLVYVEGELTYRKYSDNNNIERMATEIKASDVRLMGGNPEQRNNTAPTTYGANGMPQGGYRPQGYQQQGANPNGFQQTGNFPQQPVQQYQQQPQYQNPQQQQLQQQYQQMFDGTPEDMPNF